MCGHHFYESRTSDLSLCGLQRLTNRRFRHPNPALLEELTWRDCHFPERRRSLRAGLVAQVQAPCDARRTREEGVMKTFGSPRVRHDLPLLSAPYAADLTLEKERRRDAQNKCYAERTSRKRECADAASPPVPQRRTGIAPPALPTRNIAKSTPPARTRRSMKRDYTAASGRAMRRRKMTLWFFLPKLS